MDLRNKMTLAANRIPERVINTQPKTNSVNPVTTKKSFIGMVRFVGPAKDIPVYPIPLTPKISSPENYSVNMNQ